MDNTLREIQKAKKGRKEFYAELKTLKKELREREKRAISSVMNRSQVVLSTLSGAANKLLDKRTFDYVVIDEVSQSLEAECWIAALKVCLLLVCSSSSFSCLISSLLCNK